jgi:hypothetical protein
MPATRHAERLHNAEVSLLGTYYLNMPGCEACIPQNCIGWLILGRIG